MMPPPDTTAITRRVMWSQLLFVAGNSLTVGSFFHYFVAEFHPSSFLLAAAMIAPETSQSLSVFGRMLMAWMPNRKRNWILFLIAGRLIAMLLPLAFLFPAPDSSRVSPITFILACTVGWYLLQGIAYVNYVSWLSDLVPRSQWGHLFSRRQLAGLSVSLGFPFLAAWLRQSVLKGLPDTAEQWSYSALFTGGGILVMVSIIPLLSCPEIPWKRAEPVNRISFSSLRLSRSFLSLLMARWWLAFFQGLTQAAFFKYAVFTLKISLPVYTTLGCVMVLSQMPMAAWGGHLSDRNQDKAAVWGSMLLVSFAVPCWFFATPQTWGFLWLAYLLWGGFGMLNVCGQNLCLKLAPMSDNTTHFALYDQVAGLIAGMAGLLGGFWLDQLLSRPLNWDGTELNPFFTLFAISWLGRLTAPLWISRVKQPEAM